MFQIKVIEFKKLYAKDRVSKSTNMRRAVRMSRRCKDSQIIMGTKIRRSLYCRTDI